MSRTGIRFKALVEQASQAPLPPIDVTDRVMQSIGRYSLLPTSDWPMWPTAVSSLAVALAVLLLAAYRGALFEDPLAHWFSSLVMVMR